MGSHANVTLLREPRRRQVATAGPAQRSGAPDLPAAGRQVYPASGEGEQAGNRALIAGAVAGLSVDSMLFPIDTIKTRMQAPGGLHASGGFRNLYRGLGFAALASAPCSALFFYSFESTRVRLQKLGPHGELGQLASDVCAAAFGELVASSVRVPIEALKQLRQTRSARVHGRSLWAGWPATICRDVPFSVIQFPLYHLMKRRLSETLGTEVTPWQAALCGSCTAAFAALLTTPFDMAKTQINLRPAGDAASAGGVFETLRAKHRAAGLRGLFAGWAPRAAWMALGGLVFLGSYEQVKAVLVAAEEREGAPRDQIADERGTALIGGELDSSAR